MNDESDNVCREIERIQAWKKEATEQRADKERAERMLREYGQHRPHCASRGDWERGGKPECDCGWDKARAAVEEK